MGSGMLNRGRIGIQPYPVDDLQLQGYVPKTLYVPDDISVNVSIIAGINGNNVRIPNVDDDNRLSVHVGPNNEHTYEKIYYDDFIVNRDTPNYYIIDVDISNSVSVLSVFKPTFIDDPGPFTVYWKTTIVDGYTITMGHTNFNPADNSDIYGSYLVKDSWPLGKNFQIVFNTSNDISSFTVKGLVVKSI